MPKFNKAQALEKIKAQLILRGEKQEISDRTISDTLESLMMFAGEETELDAFATQILPTFVSMNGNLRHEVAEKVKGIPPANPPAPSPTTPPATDQTQAELLKKIMDRLEAQDAKEALAVKKVASEAKITAAKELLKAQGATDAGILKYTMKGMEISDEITAEQLAAQVLPQYNKDFKEIKGTGSVPANPSAGLSATAAVEAQNLAKEMVRKQVEKTGITVPEKQ